MLLAQPVWTPKAVEAVAAPPAWARHLVLACGLDERLVAELAECLPAADCRRLDPGAGDPAARYRALCRQLFEVLQAQAGAQEPTLVQVVLAGQGGQRLFAGLAGLLKSARLENPKLLGQLLDVGSPEAAPALAARLRADACRPEAAEIRYEGRQRQVPEWALLPDEGAPPALPWKERGVYLLAGGAGGLGLLLAEEIARQVQGARLVLAGRSAPGAEQQRRLEALRAAGATVEWRQADLARRAEVEALVAGILEAHGGLDGVLQCAGLLRDGFLLNQTAAELEAVLAPKVAGTVNLDEATAGLALDFFLLFSSAAVAHGSAGQAGYCAANAFLNAFAGQRNEQVAAGRRRGRTLALDWPLWRAGGMRPGAAAEQAMTRSTGLVPLETAAGMAALYRGLASGLGRVLVLAGDPAATTAWLAGGERPGAVPAVPGPEAPDPAACDSADLRREAARCLKGLLSETLGTPAARIDAGAPLETYGLDSIAVTQLNQKLEAHFAGLPKTLFYQHQTVEALAGHLADRYRDACLAWTGLALSQPAAAPPAESLRGDASAPAAAPLRRAPLPEVVDFPGGLARPRPDDTLQEPIAIIGISGRYPEAETLEAFWENLRAGRDSVGEIPAERWPLDGFYEPDPDRAVAEGRSYSKWGGFLEGFADFDPLFFNIAPRDALSLDPQERLFLQASWQVLEDAGYTRETLRRDHGRNVGVFVGITKTGFELHGPALWARGQAIHPHTSFGSVANRVSYCLDLRGPSMPIDTLCSSSLTAIHEACQHIRNGDCELAIAGGVNLYLHPSTYVGLCSAYMLSRDGRCRSFGAGGKGFVPGEGVGAVLLKRLSQAEADGDRILAVIRGSSVNHGGKTNGYTVPSPGAQAALIGDCLRKAGVEACSLGYVEAHGTGTELGDPIEVAGLTEAFSQEAGGSGLCALGSVKANVGHLEAAAGIAGLTKIVLQLRHRQLAPSLHAGEPNPNINFAATPFVVQQELAEWRRPVVEVEGEARELPRRAGLSSFGAGGANAHLVIEEYLAPERPAAAAPAGPAVVLLSARSEERLRQVATDLLAFLERADPAPALHDLAYTLQVGREPLEERLGLVVASLAELRQALADFLDGRDDPRLRRGRIERNRERLAALAADEAFQETLDKWLAGRRYDSLLDFWVRGLPVEWARLYPGDRPRRIGLPTYPFARQRYWFDDLAPVEAPAPPIEPAAEPAELIALRPAWEAVGIPEGDVLPAADARIAVVGTPGQRQAVGADYPAAAELALDAGADIATLAEALRRLGRLDHLVWFAPPGDPEAALGAEIVEAQQAGVLQLFRLVKALLQEGYGDGGFGLTVVTRQALAVQERERADPTHAAVHGLAGSLAREQPAWQVRLLDIGAEASWPLPGLWRLPPHPQAASYAWRGREWLEQRLLRLSELPAPGPGQEAAEPYRRQGVYLVVGGAGALGEAWSRMLIERHQARLVWLGRSPLTPAIQAKLDGLAAGGTAPEYLQADARDAEALRRALEEIRRRHGQVHGVVVATLGDYDRGLAEMSEALFGEILSTKLEVAVQVADCFAAGPEAVQPEPLDFLAFFSSLVGFGRTGGMAGYAAACSFTDAFARRLALERDFPVKVVDWGYWALGGGARVSEAVKRLVERRGVTPLEPEQGLAALGCLIASPLTQLAVTRTSRPELIESFAAEEWTRLAPARGRSCAAALAAFRPDGPAPEPGEATEALNGWIARLLFVQLCAMGALGQGGAQGAEALRRQAGILDKYQRWWRESLEVLRQYGYLRAGAAGPVELAGDPPDAGQAWRDWQAEKPRFLAGSETRTLAVLVEDSLAQLPEVLRGTTLVTDILFPDGSLAKIEGLYKHNRICDHFNAVVAGAVEAFVAGRVAEDPAARIRILEIGAGTGGTTDTLLPRLEPWRAHLEEYCYTDLSRSFFDHARQRYGEAYPYLRYRLFDVERPLDGQGIEAGGYDLVVATNVLHATRSLRNTLRNAKAALGANGLLVLNEISDKTVFASVLFGLIDGWSLAEDGHWRIPGSPGLYPAQWRSLLEQEGFAPVLFPAEADHALGQQIVVAESDGLIRQRDAGERPAAARAARAASPVVSESPPAAGAGVELGADLAGTVEALILEALAGALGIEREAIDLEVPFSDYGIDSILGVGFVQQLNRRLGLSLKTTVLFDHTTAERLARHLLAEHREAVGLKAAPAVAREGGAGLAEAPPPAASSAPRPAGRGAPEPTATDPDEAGIAVIGLSGQFPGAADAERFWRNMVEGVDAVSELPAHYLDPGRYSPDRQPGKSYCRWGGVLEGRDCFDPLFFSLSPREAESMNPHQRLILEESWKALEDAGYAPRSLSQSRTGVFVGCEPSGYVHETFTGASDAIVASRLSYFLDLKGPAFVVNTGCSSSGVALHLACESLRTGECDLALAGGAFAVMGETILVGLSQTEMLSRSGRCRSFDAEADGMAMSEGVGMVALKRLDRALADGDAVYGVIRASGINQDGASNGITAPSGLAQQQLIAEVYRRFGVDPERIGYVETHGTGTRLGDPVEANALVAAFRQFTDKAGYCAIGSAKSHIGHTSANAGVTGLISVLLSLKHRRLPALLHFERLNPLIDFEGSPFYPNTRLADWRSPDGRPLMAALNSFGHSGTNVHLVIEEFVDPRPLAAAPEALPELILVSARDEERLEEALRRLRDFLEGEAGAEASLADVAYTLQTGREALEQRVALVARDREDLLCALAALLEGQPAAGAVWRGQVEPKRGRGQRSSVAGAEEIEGWLAGRSLESLAAAWVAGAPVDWTRLCRPAAPRRLHLPTYPFARERYWKPETASGLPGPAPQLHPLVQANSSTLHGQEFRSRFTGEEFFLADHRVQGRRTLPGVAYLEMARAAATLALGGGTAFRPLTLEHVVWTAPLAVEEVAVEVSVAFDAPREGAARYRVASLSPDGARQLHHQGQVRLEPPAPLPALDLSALRARFAAGGLSPDGCYDALAAAGVRYGPSHKGLRSVFASKGEVLAELRLPEAVAGTAQAYALHPSLLDAALQATVALALDGGTAADSASRPVLLPFALDSLEVLGPCEATLWAWIRPSEAPAVGEGLSRLDLDLCSEIGEVRVRLRGFASRVLRAPEAAASVVTRFEGGEFFLSDHGGMVPAAVFLELARQAAATRGEVTGLGQVVWPQPLLPGEGGGALETLLSERDGTLGFSMTTRSAGAAAVVHCQGQVSRDPAEAAETAPRNLAAIRARCGAALDRRDCDALLRSTHGPTLLSIEELRHGGEEALARLLLPEALRDDGSDWMLHPSLLNGAILAGVAWALTRRPGAPLPMPFALERLRIFRPLPAALLVHVRRSGEAAAPGGSRETLDLALLDLEGRPLALLERFTIVFGSPDDALVLAAPEWVDRPLAGPEVSGPEAAPVFLLAEGQPALAAALQARWPAARLERLAASADAPEADFLRLLACCRPLLEEKEARPLLLLMRDDDQAPLRGALTGLLKTLRLEQPRIAAQTVLHRASDPASTAILIEALAAEIAAGEPDPEVRLDAEGRRQVRTLVELEPAEARPEGAAFAPGDVVWIAGGLGGIGRIVARYLGEERGARLVLSGRSAPDAEGRAFLEALERRGVELLYLQADVAEPEAAAEAVARIEARFGGLQSIVHAAGVIEDDYLRHKTAEQAARVLRPKVAGVLALDAATRHLPLKSLILFSSIAGVLGNPGQADYAGANAFLDGFARFRNAEARQGRRAGRTLSLDWPLWRDGGMAMGAESESLMRQATGMAAMDAGSGLRALERALDSGQAQVLVAFGEAAAIRERLLAFRPPRPVAALPEERPEVDPAAADALERRLAQAVSADLVRLVAEVQRIRPERISLQRDLSDYGFDSISFTQLANALNGRFALSLMPTLFFEIPDLAALAGHLLARHRPALLKTYDLEAQPEPEAPQPALQPAPRTLAAAPLQAAAEPGSDSDAIAVIGIGAKLPGAVDLEDFWRQLEAGADLIGEVPPERWDWRAIYGDPHEQPGRTRVKWGGFLADADCFDAGFFGISPVEAQAMDPQFRLFLETVWATLEDAGYAAGALAGSRTGVFAGVATADYRELLVEARRRGLVRTGSEPFPFMVSNRVSYWFDFHGPSEVIDTACSSSLIAVHRAIESLRQGACDLALAGGVNVLASPRITVASSQAGLLSEDGRCMTFDARANGYVRSEGVAVLLLKPLARALADGDRIQGVIRASGENHGGRSSSPTAPNAAAQKQLLVEVYERAGIDPATVGYIEAHGTGTALGDPVEVNGLTAAFAELYHRRGDAAPAAPACGLGSVKANIGHLEAAAGATGLLKVLLMLRHRRIPGNPQLRVPNPYLQLEGSPFYLVGEGGAWEPPLDAAGRPLPRRAGVSSFGVGGSNAHVLVEEYLGPDAPSAPAHEVDAPALIVLSARDEPRLRAVAERLLGFLRARPDGSALREEPGLRDKLNLRELAYTLQVGREAMAQRLAFQADSLAALEGKLAGYVEGAPVEGLLAGRVEPEGEDLLASHDEDLEALVGAWIAKGRHDRLLAAWVKGLRIDWRRLYPGRRPARIALPTYPFARERHWLPPAEAAPEPVAPDSPAEPDDAVLVFEEVWSEAPLPEAPASGEAGRPIRRLLCFLSDPERQEAAVARLRALAPGTEVLFVEQGAGAPRAEAGRYRIDPERPESYAAALRAIRETAGDADALLYLWPLEEPRLLCDPLPILHLLQALAAVGASPGRLLLSGTYGDSLERCHLDSWIAFERSLASVLPQTEVVVVFRAAAGQGTAFPLDDWLGRLWAELQAPRLGSACHEGEVRLAPRLQPAGLRPAGESLLRQGGTYLITGGCGGLGRAFAEHLAGRYAARLLLTGRAPLDDGRRATLQRLRDLGGEVLYRQVEAADEGALRAAVAEAEEAWGRIDGVLHAAGVGGAAPVLKADPAAFRAVLEAKVAGTEVLERVFSERAPDFLCHVSSSSAILGDLGSCDYALGNRFQTASARYAEGPGRRLAINWPLWRDGGRGLGDAEQTRLYLEASGQRGLASEEGLELFERLLDQDGSQYLVLAGRPERLRRIAGAPPGNPADPGAPRLQCDQAPARPVGRTGGGLEQRVLEDLREQVRELLGSRPEDLRADRNLADFGFDSISLAEFARVLARFYSLEISPSLFFSYATLGRLAGYLTTRERAALEAFYGEREARAASEPAPSAQALPAPAPAREAGLDEPIAILGTSGRFPKARSVEELWRLLEEGVDAVEEIPADRFDWRRYYAAAEGEPGRTNSKWCGAIPGIAEFDPLFFEISPLEAERMDPRQRHLLQESWLALENAAYGPAQIARQRIGMFVGVEEGSDYQRRLEQVSLTSTHNGILASRLAYFLDLKGPVMALNTACSSALVAAHMACQSLRQGECDAAVAAGVNLLVSPEAYVGMTQAGMLSPDGRCRVFDRGASGMVPGEAVAVVVLKRLSRALADGDPIQAVIRGSGVNYDGRTNGITAPSGLSQSELLRGVYERCRLRPQDIGYVVAHGTGTRLGDPVEINALNEAFTEGRGDGEAVEQGWCALTSTKSNLGHTFAASGLVSLIALVEALRHATIPASLHCEEESDYIRWRESPFYVNKQARPWPAEAGRPRIGAVSAFGMSGTNAHLVVQEHFADTGPAPEPAPWHLLALSARTAEALRDAVGRLGAWLRTPAAAAAGLPAISYTLLQGRQHFEHRCIFLARDLEEAAEALWRAENPDSFGIVASDFAGDPAAEDEVADLCRRAAGLAAEPEAYRTLLLALADFHCRGQAVDWSALFPLPPRRVRLPGYAFARERHWLEEREQEPRPAAAEAPRNRLHPLVDRADPDPERQRFFGRVGPEDSRCGEEATFLPTLFCPEMARFAAQQALGRPVAALANLVWGAPLAARPDGETLAVELYRAGETVAYGIEREGAEGRCSQIGEILPAAVEAVPERVDLARLRAGLKPVALEGLLAALPRDGAVYADATRLLATLVLPEDADDRTAGMPFQPCYLEAAWRLASLLARRGGAEQRLHPFSLRHIEARGPMPGRVTLQLTRRAGAGAAIPTFDAVFYDATGAACAWLSDFAMTTADRLADIPLGTGPLGTGQTREARS
ncbi:MAG: SDR family NAD(P)-dependent oxidoreductase [Tistlia sp.]|uniref:SDR family NAD(P)-dependent oxidoreductase n=1 Tax=Tistlia sp. TaxID=3057121 RepID=UPI0034A22224